MVNEHFNFFSSAIAEEVRKQILNLDYRSGEVDREYVEPVGKSADVEQNTELYKTFVEKLETDFPQVKKYKLFRVFVNLFEPGDLPYFHKDATKGLGTTFLYYPQDQDWELDDRGETDVFIGKELRSYMPIPNKLIEFDGTLFHRGNSFRDRDRYSLVAQYKY